MPRLVFTLSLRRRARSRVCIVAATFLLLLAIGSPLTAGEPGRAVDLWSGLPAPADTGKAVIFTPPPAAVVQKNTERCLPALPCGTRLVGSVRKNGAVELQLPALRW
jgi:hypothetical protein